MTQLPDREIATVEAWLADHPEIAIVSRDRGGGYGEAAARALPHAIQIADRWHLMENASAAFFDAVRISMRSIRTTIGGESRGSFQRRLTHRRCREPAQAGCYDCQRIVYHYRRASVISSGVGHAPLQFDGRHCERIRSLGAVSELVTRLPGV